MDEREEMESNAPDITYFRAIYKEVASQGKADSWGGMECVRKFRDWKKAGKPLDGLAKRLGW